MRDAEAIQRVLKAVATTVSKAAAQAEILRVPAKRNSGNRSKVAGTVRTRSAGTASRQATDVQFEEVPRSASTESLSSTRKIPGFSSI